ncbi:MAG: hypothetical protein CW691_05475 [Candidatus Bathyarchaeum sp.]|nr:MAG: hypothetical protein CW691_05475 [Candidatus Bathyarchaeum sp.]
MTKMLFIVHNLVFIVFNLNDIGHLVAKGGFLCFLCFTLFLGSVTVVQAQPPFAPDVDWQQTYGYRQAEWIAETTTGGYAFLTPGYYSVFRYPGYDPAKLTKIDSSGNIQWVQNISLPFPESIITTSDGGYAYTGRNDSVLIISKRDSNGDNQWSLSYDGPLSGPGLIVQTSDNGFAVVAHNITALDSAMNWISELLFIKIDAQGTIKWTKRIDVTGGNFRSFIQTSDGGYALAGDTTVTRHTLPDMPTGSKIADSRDFYLIKIDHEGNLQWSNTYGGINEDAANSLVQTDDGGYALAGNTESFGAGASDAFLVKTDASGNLEWAQDYGGFGTAKYLNSTIHQNGIFNDFANSLVQTSDGGLAFAGKAQWQSNSFYIAWLVKTDIYGNMQWNQTFYHATFNFYGATDGNNWGVNSLIQTKSGAFVMAGYTSTDYRESWFGCFIIKTEPATPLSTTASPSLMSSLDLEPIIIAADGTVVPLDVPITREGNRYTFTGDIHNPLVVEADNIVIDGQGHLLSGSDTINNLFIPQSQVGINLFNLNNVTLQNIDIQNFKVGIFLDNTNNITICQNKLRQNYHQLVGINSTNTLVTENELTGHYEAGIYLAYCLNNKIVNNQIAITGVSLEDCSGNIVSNNNFNNGGCGVNNCENTLISGNTFHDILGSMSISNTIDITVAANSFNKAQIPFSTNGVPGVLVYMNSFIDCTYPPIIPEGATYIDGESISESIKNRWDNGTVGNYWSNYTTQNPNATQINSSATWDTPYVINGNNTDNHPLINPVSSDESQALSQALISSHIPSTELRIVDPDYIVFQPDSIPEFSAWLIIPLFLTLTLAVTIHSRKFTKR